MRRAGGLCWFHVISARGGSARPHVVQVVELIDAEQSPELAHAAEMDCTKTVLDLAEVAQWTADVVKARNLTLIALRTYRAVYGEVHVQVIKVLCMLLGERSIGFPALELKLFFSSQEQAGRENSQ